MEKIETLIENLQTAFADVPKPEKINGCGCGSCLNQVQCDTLLELSSRIQMTLNDEKKAILLCDYIDDAIWTVGDVQDFTYFVPKILELCLSKYDFLENSNTFIKKIALAGFNDWNSAKQTSVEAAIYRVIDQGIRSNSHEFDDWMSGLCGLDVNHQHFIDLLDRDCAEVSRRCFINYHYPESWEAMCMKGPYWDDLPFDKTQVVHNWLVSQPPL